MTSDERYYEGLIDRLQMILQHRTLTVTAWENTLTEAIDAVYRLKSLVN